MSNLIISERLECPLCNKPINPKVSSSKGNVTCSNCFPILTKPLPSNNRTKASVQCETDSESSGQREELNETESTQNQSCPFSRSGCQAVLNVGEVENHKFDCSFSCMNFCLYLGFPKCDHETASADLSEHLVSKHSVDIINARVKASVQVHQSGRLDNSTYTNTRWNPVCIIHEGIKFFLQTTLPNKKTISWHVSALGSIETAEKFSATITIPSQKVASSKWKGQVLPITECNNPSSSFILPIAQLKEMSSRNNQSDVDEWQLEILIENKSIQYPSTSKIIPVATSQARIFKRKCSLNETEDGIPNHPGFECDSCSQNPVVGIRYRCMLCENYDLCQTCMDKDSNSHADHIFLRISKYDNVSWNFNSLAATLGYGRVTFDVNSEEEDEESDSDHES